MKTAVRVGDMPRGYRGRLTKAGLPDRRTTAGKTWFAKQAAKQAAVAAGERKRQARREAARRGWETRKARERERRDAWEFPTTSKIIVEEPIDTVGGPRTQSGKRRKK